MYCPKCKAEIKHDDPTTCPNCSTVLPQNARQKQREKDAGTEPVPRRAETAGGSSEESDEDFDFLLERIADQVDHVLEPDEPVPAGRPHATAGAGNAVERESDEFIDIDDFFGVGDAPPDEPDDVIELTNVVDAPGQKNASVSAAISGKGVQLPGEWEDDESIEEITEEDIEFVFDAPEKVEKPAQAPVASEKPGRSSKRKLALAGVVVLLFVVVFGIRFFPAEKPAPLEPKPALSPKRVEPQKPPVNRERPVEPVKALEPPENSRSTPTAEQQPAAAVDRTPGPSDPGQERLFVPQNRLRIDAATQEAPRAPEAPGKTVEKAPVRAVEPAEPTFAQGEPFFTIQVQSLHSKQLAEATRQELERKGFPAYLVERKNSRGDIRYKLRIGKYKARKEAGKEAEAFKASQGQGYIIVESTGD